MFFFSIYTVKNRLSVPGGRINRIILFLIRGYLRIFPTETSLINTQLIPVRDTFDLFIK